MGKTKGVIALLAIGGFVLASQAKAADIGVATLKYIAIDKETAAGKSKTVFVSKDAAAALSGDNDVENISVTIRAQYTGALGNANAIFDIPAGSSNGTEGWLVVKDAVAKYVNKSAPGGSTGIKVAVIKPGKLLKGIGKTRGDSTQLDLIGAGAPTGDVYTAYTVNETSGSNNFCSSFSGCSYKEIGGGTGRKLVCKGGVADGGCTAAGPPPVLTVAEFTTGPAGGGCGVTRVGGSGGALDKTLTCGGLNIGGGGSTVPEGPTPANAPTRFNASCAGTNCTLSARTSAQDGGNNSCTDTGCNFGTYLSIANGGLSTCVHNTFASPGSGSLDTATGAFSGSVPLSSEVTVTGNAANPCPDCVAGVPSTCDGTATNAGAVCTPVNGSGDTYDCTPSGVVLAPFPVNLTPLTSGQATANGPTFCPGQSGSAPGLNGCFGNPACDYIEENGSAAAGISVGGGTVPATLVSVFCIPATGNGLIDGAADLPGPGATALPGTLELL